MIHDVVTPAWQGYELIDSGDGMRLERFGVHTVVRPDPNVLWPKSLPDHTGWKKPSAHYIGREQGWEADEALLAGWNIDFKDVAFRVKPTPFRHMGLFPEQAAQWTWLEDIIESAVSRGKKPSMLNLFAYTGAATVVAAKAGAKVCHVDAAKGSVQWAKENARHSGLSEDAIRWIVDDAMKFLRREVRRGSRYDIVVMDPPVFGRGPKGEIWRLEEQLAELAELAGSVLSAEPLGMLINFYATTLYPQSVQRLLSSVKGMPELTLGSLSIEETGSKKSLPTGYFLRS